MNDQPMKNPLSVREANETDLPGLLAVRYAATPGIHLDRMQQAENGDLSYLVIERASEIVGFCVLVFRRPPGWSDAADPTRLPQMIDLFVAEAVRGQGVGRFFIAQIEDIARNSGYQQLFVGVDPVENPRAHALYLRLGYAPLQDAPQRTRWRFVDSSGAVHQGEEWHLDLRKPLL